MGHTEADLARVLNTGPFHLALRAALAVRGLPLQRVQHHLAHRGIKVGVTSLSYWQQGARRPQRPESLRAVRALEEVLGLPARSLVRLLGSGEDGATAETERPAGSSHHALVDSLDAAERLLTGLRSPEGRGLHTIGHQERVRIGAGRQLLGRDSQQVVRAHRDGVDRCLAVHRGGTGCDPAAVEVSALENCRPGRVRWDRASGVVVAELLFDAPLREGETYVFGYGFEDGTGGPSTEYARGFSSAGGHYMLQVRFEQGALPERCHRFSRATTGAPRGARTELTPGARHRTVHLVEQGVRPGVLGIAWDWD
ncbi:hypothetical protein ACTMTU_17605 [Streptomyces sp. OZ13]|uniref:hypothetical protein n=1 Tax=Streptomyces sp. OZ13 TaxID=3452210 RepID=UPI003F8CBFBD